MAASLRMEKNHWKVPADNTLQVVEHPALTQDGRQNRKDWKAILISMSFICFVSVMVVIAILCLLPLQQLPFLGRRLTLDDLVDPKLASLPLVSQWVSDTHFCYLSRSEGIVRLDVTNRQTEILVPEDVLTRKKVNGFSISADQSYVIVSHNPLKKHHYERTYMFSVYDLNKHRLFPLVLNGSGHQYLRFHDAEWVTRANSHQSHSMKNGNHFGHEQDRTTDDDNAHALLVVCEGHIYALRHPMDASPTRLTFEPAFNAVPDPLYKGILQDETALWINPSGSFVAFLSFNVSGVQQIPHITFSKTHLPVVKFLPYPMAGQPVTQVTLWVYDITSLRDIKRFALSLPESEDHYVTELGWASPSDLWLTSVSRDHSAAVLALCSAPQFNCAQVHSSWKAGGVVPAIKGVTWSHGWAAFASSAGPGGTWLGYVKMTSSSGIRTVQVTDSGYDVKKVIGVSEGKVYFVGSDLNKDPSVLQLFALDTLIEETRDLTKDICSALEASLSPSPIWVSVSCSIPPMTHLTLINLISGEKFTIHDQPPLREALSGIALPKILRRNLVLPNGIHARVVLKLPPEWSKDDHSLQFSLVVELVGIEDKNVIDQETRLTVADYLASGHQVAHAQISFWGEDPSVRVSVQDLALKYAVVIRFLASEYDFLDDDQVAAWSTGRSASVVVALAVHAPSLLRCIVAINPIASWKLYGAYWAERHLGILGNPKFAKLYEESDLTHMISDLKTPLTLVQGTNAMDSLQGSILAKSLIKEGILFQHVVYDDTSLPEESRRSHLLKVLESSFLNHKCITKFLEEQIS